MEKKDWECLYHHVLSTLHNYDYINLKYDDWHMIAVLRSLLKRYESGERTEILQKEIEEYSTVRPAAASEERT